MKLSQELARLKELCDGAGPDIFAPHLLKALKALDAATTALVQIESAGVRSDLYANTRATYALAQISKIMGDE